MKQLEKMIREELLHAPENVCVSLFIPPGDEKQQCDTIKELVVDAATHLRKVFSVSEVEEFIKPMASITKSQTKAFECSIALFRTKNTFKILGLPIVVQAQAFVSNHFHIKPLLQWLQEEREFFCIEFSKSSVEIFRGDMSGFQAIDSFQGEVTSKQIDEVVSNKSLDERETLVYLAGRIDAAKKFVSQTELEHIDPSIVDRSLYEGDYEKLWKVLFDRARRSVLLKVEKSLMDYNIALMNGRAESDIETIIKEAKAGRIKKLIISGEDSVWGRFDAFKNQINRINEQINYEDDDLLDSISEKVLEGGGEVVVANRKQLPKNKVLLAILKAA
ncbi:MAG: hypothetical protein KC478_04520 [Bacteriovoracaceae bacterium]|nr:hypothetical protein [Bacteriovoracaceae bacterium]